MIPGALNKKKYKTLKAALKVCAKTSKCTGVTKRKSGVYSVNKGSVPKKKTGMVAYLRGGLKTTVRYVTHGGKIGYQGYCMVKMS